MSERQAVTALRVHVSHWYEEQAWRRTLEWLSTAPGTIDELALFTSETHPPLPLPVMLDRARRAAVVLAEARAAGYGAGINLLATMGHHEENLPGSLAEPYQRVVDPEGRECRGSFCPEDPAFQEGYLRPLYRALAEAGPDFIWIDDDVRLAGHGPVGLTCFCDRCLARFAQEQGRAVTRPELAAAMAAADDDHLPLRKAWLEHNRGTIDRLFRLIRQAVDEVQPGLPLGFMTGDRWYEGYAFGRWAATLGGEGTAPVRWRPGGGFYDDSQPLGLVGKAHDVGRQAAALPESVRVVQYELEDFPYHRLRKAAVTTAIESAAAMAAGCTGIAYNILAMDSLGIAENTPVLRQAAAARPFLDLLHHELGRSATMGVWPAWNQESWATGADVGGPYALAELGVPICYSRAGAVVTALSGRMPLAFGREELEEMLAGGVIMDTAALQALCDLGLGELCGVMPGESYTKDTFERLTDDPLNGPAAGMIRDCRQSFWLTPASSLIQTADGVRVLATLTDYVGSDRGVALTAFQNSRGGRVAVAGYYPWQMIGSLAKVTQYRNVLAWLSRGRLPAVVQTLAKAPLWVRAGERGRRAVVLINASLDPQPALEVALHGVAGEVEHVVMGGRRDALRARRGEPSPHPNPLPAGEGVVAIPEVAPWSVHLLLYHT